MYMPSLYQLPFVTPCFNLSGNASSRRWFIFELGMSAAALEPPCLVLMAAAMRCTP